MPKPKGTTGATKMKIMAIIYHNIEFEKECYGYDIWQSLKKFFYTYLKEGDVRNVYRHLKELSELELIEKIDASLLKEENRCYYKLTVKGKEIRLKYAPYLEIVRRSSGYLSKY